MNITLPSKGNIDESKISGYLSRLATILSELVITDTKGNNIPPDIGAMEAVNHIKNYKSQSGKVILIGNGGSAAIVSHMHVDLCKAAGIKAIAFNDTPMLTALSNDHGYECVFERGVSLWADKGDLLIAISSSGKSDNIIRGVREAISKGCNVITLSGFKPDNPLRAMGHLNFYVNSDSYGYVELIHSIITHFLTDRAMSSQNSH